MPVTRTLAKAAGLLMAANLISRLLGFLRETLIADYFGQTSATDAYNVAFILPDLLYWLLMGGVLGSALIPVFSEYIAKGEEKEGWRVVSSVANLIFLSLALLCLISLFLAPNFISLQAPGLPGEYKPLAVRLTRIILIQPLILTLSGLAMGILNSYKIFWPSALGTLLYNASIILIGPLLVSALHLGIDGFAFGVVIGAAANFAVQIPALRRLGGQYYAVIDWHHPGVRRILILAVPIIISYAVNQIPVAIYSNLGSMLPPGSISAVNRAYRLFQLPIGIFALAIAVAVFPTLSEQAAKLKWQELRQTASKAVRMVIFITIPISVGMMILRFPLIRVLFQHGAFLADDTVETTIPLVYFCVGITAQSVINILPRVFYALQDTWTPVIMGIISMAVNTLAMLLLVKVLAGGGLALAMSISGIVNMGLLFWWLRRRLNSIDGWRIMGTTLRSLGASFGMGLVVWAWTTWFSAVFGTGLLVSVAELMGGVILGVVVFTAVAKFLRMEEFVMVYELFISRFFRRFRTRFGR